MRRRDRDPRAAVNDTKAARQLDRLWRRFLFQQTGAHTMDIAIPNDRVISTYSEASALQQWLRPGMLSFLVGQYVAELEPHAIKLDRERAAMLDEAAMKHGEFNADGVTPNPLAGQHVVEQRGTISITLFKSKEAGDEFERREKELMGGMTTIRAERKLNMADIEKIEKERLPRPRPNPNRPGELTEFAVNFAALMPLIDTTSSSAGAPSATEPGVVQPDMPRSVS
jgi:hypothetical protein